MSAASYLEASIIIYRSADAVRRAMLDQFLEEFGIEIEPVTVEQVRMARHAFREFGQGNHPASLNFGDCLTYALTRAKREPLLFKGKGFSQTDLTPAIGIQQAP
jgi:ribonuclease VapC